MIAAGINWTRIADLVIILLFATALVAYIVIIVQQIQIRRAANRLRDRLDEMIDHDRRLSRAAYHRSHETMNRAWRARLHDIDDLEPPTEPQQGAPQP